MTALSFEVPGVPVPQGVMPKRVRDAFIVANDGCWIWQLSCSRDGYGWAHFDGKTRSAHRLVYELVKGPIEDGMVLDHLCRVRHCVNPAHLEPVSPAENVRRSPLTPAGQDHCLRCGGEFIVIYERQRRCRRCLAEYNASRYRARYAVLARAQRHLGLTQRQYRERYGSSTATALRILGEAT